MTCPFCTIPEIKDREITGDDLVWAFPTNIPITPGHTLIVPRRCVPNFSDLTSDEREAIWKLAEKIRKALQVSFGAQGFNYAWNEGRVAGQSVPHFHPHILPRTEGDEGVLHYDPRTFLYRPGPRLESDESVLRDVAARIKKAL
jgi:histidine triad (HIT) family protein